jgi:hypothetical protein
MNVRYIVFGHTHETDLRILSSEPQRAEYLNDGTWTKVFFADWEDQFVKEESEFTFAQVDEAKQEIHLLRWRDELGASERARLFEMSKGTD